MMSDEKKQELLEEKPLSPFACRLITAILEDSISQLNLLGNTLAVPILSCKLKYTAPNERYRGLIERGHTSMDKIHSPLNNQILQKLQNERTCVEGIISGALHELEERGTYVFLQNAVSYLENLREDDNNLMKIEKGNQEMLKMIRKKISEEKINSDRTLQAKCDEICQIQDKMIEENETGKVIKNFVKHWEKASQEQLLIKLNISENSQHEKLKSLVKDLEDEVKTSESVITYLTSTCEDLNGQIVHWKKQYGSDVGSIQQTIADLKFSKDLQSQKYNELEKEYNVRQREMDEFLVARAERQRKEALEHLERESAVRLQAWWRGLMVRRCLGQFRRRKKIAKEARGKQKKGKGRKQ